MDGCILSPAADKLPDAPAGPTSATSIILIESFPLVLVLVLVVLPPHNDELPQQ